MYSKRVAGQRQNAANPFPSTLSLLQGSVDNSCVSNSNLVSIFEECAPSNRGFDAAADKPGSILRHEINDVHAGFVGSKLRMPPRNVFVGLVITMSFVDSRPTVNTQCIGTNTFVDSVFSSW